MFLAADPSPAIATRYLFIHLAYDHRSLTNKLGSGVATWKGWAGHRFSGVGKEGGSLHLIKNDRGILGIVERGSRRCPPRVRLDAPLVLTTLAGLVFLWPLIVYGRPAYFSDSASYFKGGRAAVSFFLEWISEFQNVASTPLLDRPTGISDAASRGAELVTGRAKVHGTRSITYSILAFIFSAPRGQMWLLAAVQALLTAFLVAITLFAYGKSDRLPVWKIAILAAATPVALVTCLIIPDIFAGLLILAITLLTAAYERLSTGVRLGLMAIAAGAITFHMSHVPIALGVTVVALGSMAFPRSRSGARSIAHWSAVAAPLLAGTALLVSLNLGAFGTPSLTGKRFPLTLARSVADGPAKWYLEQNCAQLDYAICELYPRQVPGDLNEFLWGKNGIKARATPDQLERIRREESEVVLAAARSYPLEELSIITGNFARQLVLFEPIGFDTRLMLDGNQNAVTVATTYNPAWIRSVEKLSAVVLVVSLLVLMQAWRTKPELRRLIGLILWGVALNAAVCVYFSGITGRYQARVIWLIPLIALAVVGQVRPAETSQSRGGSA